MLAVHYSAAFHICSFVLVSISKPLRYLFLIHRLHMFIPFQLYCSVSYDQPHFFLKLFYYLHGPVKLNRNIFWITIFLLRVIVTYSYLPLTLLIHTSLLDEFLSDFYSTRLDVVIWYIFPVTNFLSISLISFHLQPL